MSHSGSTLGKGKAYLSLFMVKHAREGEKYDAFIIQAPLSQAIAGKTAPSEEVVSACVCACPKRQNPWTGSSIFTALGL